MSLGLSDFTYFVFVGGKGGRERIKVEVERIAEVNNTKYQYLFFSIICRMSAFFRLRPSDNAQRNVVRFHSDFSSVKLSRL